MALRVLGACPLAVRAQAARAEAYGLVIVDGRSLEKPDLKQLDR